MAADACEAYGVSLYDDPQTLKKVFSDLVPEFGSVKNPVDITGQAKVKNYERALHAGLKSKKIHSIICLGCETAVLEVEKLPLTIQKVFLRNKSVKPIVFSFLGGVKTENCINHLKAEGIAIFSDVYEAVSCLGAMYAYYHNVKRPIDATDVTEEIKIDQRVIEGIIKKVGNDQRHFLLPHEAREIMKAADIPIPKSYLAHNIDEAVKYAERIGYPVVMKIVSKDIIHKSDVDGVALDLENRNEVMDAYQAIIHNCREHEPNAILEGVEISEMVPSGTEIIIGARRDKVFGPLVMFGLGGIYVEVMHDVSFRALPLNKKEVMAMIEEIKSYPLLLGVRGEKKKDIDSVIDTIIKLGTILQQNPAISDIEINPLVIYQEGRGAKAVDAKIIISKVGR